MFVWSTQAILRELEANLPLHVQHLTAAVENFGTDAWPQALVAGLDPLESISIDFAVMEKAREVRCVASSFSWTDLGGWLALLPFLDEDTDGNACRGRVRTLDARGNLIYCDDPAETVVVVGVEGLVAVRSGDRTLIVPRDRAGGDQVGGGEAANLGLRRPRTRGAAPAVSPGGGFDRSPTGSPSRK